MNYNHDSRGRFASGGGGISFGGGGHKGGGGGAKYGLRNQYDFLSKRLSVGHLKSGETRALEIRRDKIAFQILNSRH